MAVVTAAAVAAVTVAVATADKKSSVGALDSENASHSH